MSTSFGGRVFITGACAALITVGAASPAFALLHPGDRVSVLVYNHPELSNTITINGSGSIFVPLAGTVDAANSDPKAVAERIRVRLVPYIRHVAVEVAEVAQSSSLFVAGGPGGVLPYQPGETLVGAIGQALQQNRTTATDAQQQRLLPVASTDPLEGPTDLHNVRILRDGAAMGPYDVDDLMSRGEPGPTLHPDDTIAFADKPIAVSVNGAVRAAGVAHLDPNEPLFDALQQVGGIDEGASTIRLVLHRDGQTQTITTSSPEYSAPAQPGDSLTVPNAVHVTVTGDVVKPGEITLRGDSSVISALYYAGGPDATGDLRQVHVVHLGTQTSYNVAAVTHGVDGNNPILSDGDTVYVPSDPKPKIDFGGIFKALIGAPWYLLTAVR
jgi:protein involved in polysaccharide export with SLBB domain